MRDPPRVSAQSSRPNCDARTSPAPRPSTSFPPIVAHESMLNVPTSQDRKTPCFADGVYCVQPVMLIDWLVTEAKFSLSVLQPWTDMPSTAPLSTLMSHLFSWKPAPCTTGTLPLY